MKKLLVILAGVLAVLASCKHEILNPGGLNPHPDSTGTGPNGSICFESDILPMYVTSCGSKDGCHNAKSHEEGLVLDSYEGIMKGGVVAGNPAKSKMYTVLFESGESKMPRDAPEFTVDQKNKIAQWITEGALNTTACSVSCDDSKFAFAANVQPILNNNCIACHNNSLTQGGINLTNWNGASAAKGKIPAAIQWTNSDPAKHMPQPPASKLSACNISVILNWINAGAPNN